MGKAMTVGDPTLESTEIGPLIRPAEIQRVNKWVNDAVKGGARLLSGGRPLSDTCYPATVLLDPPDSSIISQNEIFGPVIFVYSYNNLDEAIQRANALPYSFQSAVFTASLDIAMKPTIGSMHQLSWSMITLPSESTGCRSPVAVSQAMVPAASPIPTGI